MRDPRSFGRSPEPAFWLVVLVAVVALVVNGGLLYLLFRLGIAGLRALEGLA